MKGRRNSARGTPGVFLTIFVVMTMAFGCGVWSQALRGGGKESCALPTAVGDYHLYALAGNLFDEPQMGEVLGKRLQVYRRSDEPMQKESRQMAAVGWVGAESWRVYTQLPLPGPKDKAPLVLYAKVGADLFVELGERNHWSQKK